MKSCKGQPFDSFLSKISPHSLLRLCSVRCRAQHQAPSAMSGQCCLGASGMHIPRLSLGTMQFGEGISETDSMRLMSLAAEKGINFLDTAEMYPVPQKESTAGASEKLVGRYIKRSGRHKHMVCTKVCGPSGQMSYIRGGPVALDRRNITEAIDTSLQRLETDYIDLCLLHWPDRYVPMFGESEFKPDQAYSSVPLEEQYDALAEARTAGKILEFGVSNETPWGLMRLCELCRQRSDGSRIAAIQNAYSLLCRTLDTGLTECCYEENIGIMAYSPLAMGLLTGKYKQKEKADPEARLNKYKGRYAEAESRYGAKPNVTAAVQAYCLLARQAGMQPHELAIRFNLSRPMITSTVIGVTNAVQLHQLVAAAEHGPLPADVLQAIDGIHQQYPNPTP